MVVEKLFSLCREGPSAKDIFARAYDENIKRARKISQDMSYKNCLAMIRGGRIKAPLR